MPVPSLIRAVEGDIPAEDDAIPLPEQIRLIDVKRAAQDLLAMRPAHLSSERLRV